MCIRDRIRKADRWVEVTWIKKKEKFEYTNKDPTVVLNPETNRFEWNPNRGKDHYKAWSKRRYKGNRDYHARRDCLYRVVHSTWWDWKAGSRHLFWRWQPDMQHEICDGMMVYFQSDPPNYTKPQPKHRDPATKPKVEEKLQKIVD